MSFLSQLFAKRGSAPVARDRLQILLAHERAHGGPGSEGQSELIAKLREEILDVIARHVPIDRDKVQIKLDRGAAVSTLEIDIEVPQLKKPAAPVATPSPATPKPPAPAAVGATTIEQPSSAGAKAADAPPAIKGDPADKKSGLPTGS